MLAFAWFGQFLGHFYYEGVKPAFFDDLKYLGVGPMFMLTEIFYMFGWNPELAELIHKKAVDKR